MRIRITRTKKNLRMAKKVKRMPKRKTQEPAKKEKRLSYTIQKHNQTKATIPAPLNLNQKLWWLTGKG